MAVSPFVYQHPLPPADMIDRDQEAGRLLDAAFDGVNMRLVAPRQYGKTTLLQRLVREAADGGLAAVYVDFFGVLTLTDVAQRVEQAYAEYLPGDLAEWFARVRKALRANLTVGGGPVPASASVGVDPQSSVPLLDRLALPRRLHEKHGTRTLVVFDEFQEVLAARERIDRVIRSEIQHHGQAATYVFAGSHVGMMHELFGDRRRAFYGQAKPLILSALPDEDTGEYVADRFAATNKEVGGEALWLLLNAADGHPQCTMRFADALWLETPPGRTASGEDWLRAYDQVLIDARPELRGIWSRFSGGQQRVLVTIAQNTAGLYAKSRPNGGSRGGSVRAATRELADRGEIVDDSRTVTGYRLVDPLFAAWISEGRPGA
jgi:hypothetical protein